MKVALLGSYSIATVPSAIQQQLESLPADTEFIVGDSNGVDASYHMTLSRIGASRRSTIYCLDYAKSNRFDLPTKIFSSQDLDDKEKYEYRDKQMCADCDAAVVLWDGKTNGTFKCITLLKANDKPVYIMKIDI